MALGCAPTALHADPFTLALPLDCDYGRTCIIQNYVAHDNADGARDYQCGSLTYPAHSGTDFRVLRSGDAREGVNVVAAAAGKVSKLRNTAPEGDVLAGRAIAIKGAECGNGVVIQHEDGWETQYCHLARGSIPVKTGDMVQAGTVLGKVGLSGMTEFPHVHLTVRHNGAVVDPFALDAAPGSCGKGRPLWRPDLLQRLTYRPRSVIDAGFSAGPVAMRDVDAGPAPATPNADALFAYVRLIGLRKGDVVALSLLGPDGRSLAEYRSPPFERDRAQQLVYTGTKRGESGWAKGDYTAKLTVALSAAMVLEKTFVFKF